MKTSKVERSIQGWIILMTVQTILLFILSACTGSNTPAYESTVMVAALSSPKQTLTPVKLPGFLRQVFPLPNAILSSRSYNERLKGLAIIYTGEVGVGVVLDSIAVAEVGDSLDEQDVISRVSLLIDGEPLILDTPFDWVNQEGAHTKVLDEQGQLLYEVAGGDYWMLWRKPLGLGKHEAMFRVRKTSGTLLEYSWSFELVP
ncbi:MAG: hypothetical protein JW850_21570 [Thermoflexales bacterium]|nr:hypothetical protein [Thermoflexales bacterium]